MSRLTLVQRIRLAVALVALVVGGLVAVRLWPESGTPYAAVVADASGVVPRNDVRLNDIIVGQVTGVDLDGLRARIGFELHDGVTVPDLTKVEIRQTSLLGEYFLALVPEGDGTLVPGTVIPLERTRRAAELEAIVAKAGDLTAQVNIDNINRILTSLDTGFEAGPEAVGDLFESMAGAASSLSELTGDLNATIDSIDALSARLAPDTERFQTAVDRFAGGAEALARSNEGIDALVEELDSATASLSGLLERNQDRLQRGTPVLRRILGDVVAHLGELASAISGLPAFNRGWACASDGHYLNFMFPLAPEAANIDLNPGRCDNVEEGPRGRKRPTEVKVLPGLDSIQVDDPIGTGNIDLGAGSANEGRDRLEGGDRG